MAALNVEALTALVAKASEPNGWDWMFPLRVVPVDGKPTIVSHKGGNLFRGYIATWDEADLLVALANVAPQILAALSATPAASTFLPICEDATCNGNPCTTPPASTSTAIATGREWPDIGEDPMKGPPYPDRMAVSADAIRKAYVVQQPIVPDQTALVWRWHLGALLEAEIRLRSILADDEDAAAPKAASEDGATGLVTVPREAFDHAVDMLENAGFKNTAAQFRDAALAAPPTDATGAEKMRLEVERLQDTLERLVMLTPNRANASDAQDMHCAVRAIAESALAKSPGYEDRPNLRNTDPDLNLPVAGETL